MDLTGDDIDDVGSVGDPGWVEPPWWVDAVDEADVLECPEQWALPAADCPDFTPLTPAETLLAVAAVGPGVEAIRLLASLVGQQLTEDQRLSAVQLWQPQLAWVNGAEQIAIHLFAPEPDPADPKAVLAASFLPLELAPALHTSVDQARARIGQARALGAGVLKPVGDALRAGLLDPYRVWLITDTVTKLPDDAAVTAVLEAVLPGAATRSPGQLRRALRTAARQVDPDWGVRSFATARTSRRVGFDLDGADGLIRMWAFLPPVEGLAVKEQLEAAAKVPSADPQDVRCHDERMADALIACVLGSTPGDPTVPLSPRVRLKVLVPLPTLLGLREDPAELVGFGELPGGVARELAGDADWQRWVHDPVDGHLLDQGTHTYRPSPRLRTFLADRDRCCRFPGSSRLATRCDADHNQPFDLTGNGNGGATSAANMACLSRPAHRAKTHGDFKLTHHPDGAITWTTPLGRSYTTHPWDYRPDNDRGP